jgi:hypothetical protein
MLACTLSLVSCSVLKKSSQTSESEYKVSDVNESNSSKYESIIDTTVTDKGEITIIKIEFFPPSENTENFDRSQPGNAAGVNLTNIGNFDNAAIKSIEQTTMKRETEQKRESKESSSTDAVKQEAVVSNSEKTAKGEQEPVISPIKWKRGLYIALVGLLILLLLKRVPILNWLKKILSSIRKIL